MMTPNEKLDLLHNRLEGIAQHYKRYIEPYVCNALTPEETFNLYTRSNGSLRYMRECTSDLSFIPEEVMPQLTDLLSILEYRLSSARDIARYAWIKYYKREPLG